MIVYEETMNQRMEDPTVIRKVVGDDSANNIRQLRLVLLGCEPKMPYGPIDHTAKLFLDLICLAAEKCYPENMWMIEIKTYNVQEGEYPTSKEEWDLYDGVLLPGSFSSAYDSKEWIENLKEVIQDQIVQNRRPTLGICFGHQVLAHSFEDGNVIATPSGARGGRYSLKTTPEGSTILGDKATVDLYVTHGDMVEKLPESAISLGGCEQVPIQAAAYFGSKAEATKVGNGDNIKPYAITFQAHPEYATSKDLGLYRTLELILDAQVQRGALDEDRRLQAGQDAHENFGKVQNDSVGVMITVGRLLGWFPSQ